MANKYSEYFQINAMYFPCIDSEAIRAGAPWVNTYPHDAFISLLRKTERMLAGGIHPVWIHGAYGTGKSQCGYALKKILEVPEQELREYWGKFDVLQTNVNKDLLEKLIGHKSRGIVTAYRYASGGIDGVRDLLLAVQDSVKQALVEYGAQNLGEDTLRDSVIAWLEKPAQKDFFNTLLKTPEYANRFSQSTADDVLKDLRQGGALQQLMGNIFDLADKEGVTALNLDTDRLIAWLKDVITKNDIKIVLVWDEFSDYFKNNRNSLSEFQKIVSLCQSTPFYFVIITHQTSSVITNKNDDAWKVIQQRYEEGFVEITLPDSLAFDLIGSALEVNSNAKDSWNKISDDLNSWVPDSCTAVMKDAGIADRNVIKKIMPLHPYAAMILKHIATAFEANQRSMFNFIKTANNDDVQAFQWFIANTTPEDDRPLLTVDLLWNFFYEKGRNYLTADIQSILDTYPRQTGLSEKECAVLKTVLIIQAIDQRIRNEKIELFRVTDKNLALAFEGVNNLEGNVAVNIAKKLVKDGVLYKKPIGSGFEVYAAAALAGDQAKIDAYKNKLRKETTTAKLVIEGKLANVLPLTSPLKLRFDVEPPNGKLRAVTVDDFAKTLNAIKDTDLGWRFIALIAFAKEDSEVSAFRKVIQEAAADDNYKHVIFIDALSAPLGADAFEQYLDYAAMSMYYTSNDNDLARKYAQDARNELDSKWRDRIEKSVFIVYSSDNKNGDRYPNAQSVIGALQSVVMTRFPLVFDFNNGLTEAMLKLTQVEKSAEYGAQQTSGQAVANIEKFTLAISPHSVWKVEDYWKQPALSTLPISQIKITLEKKINEEFDNGTGQISIRDLYDTLENDFGFAECNLSAFLAGFLLKEYCTDTYRFIDDTGKPMEDITKEKTLAGMLKAYIGNTNLAKYKDTYIASMTPDERAFYVLSEKAFGILPNSCVTVGVAENEIRKKMSELGLPIWALSEVDEFGVYDVVEKYIALVQQEGVEAQAIASEIGKLAQVKTTLGDTLQKLITKDNCRKGVFEFLKTFEDGKILGLAKEINAENSLIDDIRKLFSVERAPIWQKTTGEDEIRKLLIEYGVIRESNNILSSNASSLKGCYAAWRDRLKFFHISAETAKAKYHDLVKLMDILIKICAQTELLHMQLKDFLTELQANGGKLADFLNNEQLLFTNVYDPYIDGLRDDVNEVISKLPIGMFTMTASECNIKVKEKAEDVRKGQLKVKLFSLWKEKTDTNNPREWSAIHKCPILAMVVDKDYDSAKKAFETLDKSSNMQESAVKAALEFFETASFFEDLKSAEKRDEAFINHIMGNYAKILDIEHVKNKLDRLTVDAYEWFSHPDVKNAIKKLVDAEYHAGGSDKALAILNAMTSKAREEYIKRLVQENVAVGLEIITRGES